MAYLGIQMINQGGQLVAGSTELITVLLMDQSGAVVTDTPIGSPAPIGAPATVNLTLTSPSGQTVVNNAPMAADPINLGFFSYAYTSSTTDERGPWSASFSGSDGAGHSVQSPVRQVFEMIGA